MAGKWLHWSAVVLLAAQLGCSAASPKGGGSGNSTSGGQAAASGGSGQNSGSGAGQGGPVQAQALDQELRRHAQMYKEYLQHNTEHAKQRQEADRKLLENMLKQDQKARQDEIKRLQARQGLLEDEGESNTDTSQQGESSSSGNEDSGAEKQ